MRAVTALTIVSVLAVGRSATARYIPLTFTEVVFDSPVIVVGHIERLRETDYDFRVEEGLRGAKTADVLRIRRFEDWTCAERSTAYAVGQRFVAFLASDDAGLSTRGGGCEGDVILENGEATTWLVPEAMGRGVRAVPEARYTRALRTLTAGYREIGAPGSADAWRALLRDPEPMVVAGAMERLDAESAVNPRPASAFAAELVAVVAHPDRDVRTFAATHVGRWIGRAERDAAAKVFDATLYSGSPEFRPAAALARFSLDRSDPERQAALFAMFGDESLPAVERAAAARALTARFDSLTGVPCSDRLRAAAGKALESIRDPALILAVCSALDSLYREYERPEPTDAEAQRTKWRLMVETAPRRTAGDPSSPPSEDDSYLSPPERIVLVPRTIEDRARVARLVREARRARNAAKAGDKAVALDAYRTICGAAPYLTPVERKLFLDLGLAIDALTAEARELAKDE